jgi:hypothetical protein
MDFKKWQRGIPWVELMERIIAEMEKGFVSAKIPLFARERESNSF